MVGMAGCPGPRLTPSEIIHSSICRWLSISLSRAASSFGVNKVEDEEETAAAAAAVCGRGGGGSEEDVLTSSTTIGGDTSTSDGTSCC